jgi:hypothetical protein
VIEIHPHARERTIERGATEDEVVATVTAGDGFVAKYGRTGFRRNFQFDGVWRGRRYVTKQVEAYAVEDGTDWMVITVLVKFF